ncbi:hypothetical protein WJX73_002856 [Symbiochloris irregularis]|uniref:Uncharacterized protein n=1 Tax=Symbiochloris irregularis TaxID=706552 RepID=A0AAW1NLC3_9CHLO
MAHQALCRSVDGCFARLHKKYSQAHHATTSCKSGRGGQGALARNASPSKKQLLLELTMQYAADLADRGYGDDAAVQRSRKPADFAYAEAASNGFGEYEDPESEADGRDGDDPNDEDFSAELERPGRPSSAARRRYADREDDDDDDEAGLQELEEAGEDDDKDPSFIVGGRKRVTAQRTARQTPRKTPPRPPKPKYAENSEGEEEDDDEDIGIGAKGAHHGHHAPSYGVTPPAYSHAAVRQQQQQQEQQQSLEDMRMAQRMQRQMDSGTDARPRRAAARQAERLLKTSYLDDEPDVNDPEDDEGALHRGALGLRMNPRKAPHQSQRSTRGTPPASAAPKRNVSARNQGQPRVKYDEDAGYAEAMDSEDAEDEEVEKRLADAKAAAAVVPAFLTSFEGLDDEVERVLGHRDAEGVSPDTVDPWNTREFHVKWRRWSFVHCSWDTLTTLSQLGGFKRVLNYIKRQDDLAAIRPRLSREENELRDVERQMEEQLVQEHMQVERVVAERIQAEDSSLQYLVKWQGLPYSETTWEITEDIHQAGGQDAIDEFQERQRRLMMATQTVESARRAFENNNTRAMSVQPSFLAGGGTLRDYQLAGLNWLVYSWGRNYNCILADEMGLGKTIQCVSMIGYLLCAQSIAGPFLVVVPLSTVPNWIREFRRWLPQCNALVYIGDSTSRKVARAFEFYNDHNSGRPFKFDVLITTYELVLKDAAELGKIKWSYLMVDEAHRLKNHESALYMELCTWTFKNKLLITGTPLQNSLKELWALLQFLEPSRFPDCADFEARYSLDDAQGVTALHAELRPHLLRRVIKDVERSLPPKNERILRVAMTPLQKQYYKWILTRNFKELNKGTKGGAQVSLLNIITELKKCCNHPFLFDSAESDFRGSEGDVNAVDRLTVTSGKMVLLDKLLRRLKETGHRVLIFSQMVRVLDIVSDYMRLRGFQHQRLDGSTPAAQRHQAMEHFNAPGSKDFCFLLSTRAGGLGINLATADTVVIFDSDWNPQNDLQAMSRAHRIGQTETVNIYRLLTSGSVEENILERAKQKMVLDHLVIQRMDTSGRTVLDAGGGQATAKAMFGKDELAAILKFGAEELFKEDEGTKTERQHQLLAEDIDAILARAEVVGEAEQAAEGGNSDLLNAFNVATFKGDDVDEANFWNMLIPTTERVKEERAPESLGVRAARLRNAEEAVTRGDPASGEESEGSGESDQEKAPTRARGSRASTSKAGGGGSKRRSTVHEPGPPIEGALIRIDTWPTEGPDGQPLPRTDAMEVWPKRLSRRDAGAFLRGVRRYGRPERLADIAEEAGPTMATMPMAALQALWHGLISGCEKVDVQSKSLALDAKNSQLDFFGVAIKATELITFVNGMRLLARKVASVSDPAKQFRLESANIAVPKWGRSCAWTARDDAMLLLGVHWFGQNQWEAIARDERLGLRDKLAAAAVEKTLRKAGKKMNDKDSQLLPRGSMLETRVLQLLKKLESSAAQRGGGGRQQQLKLGKGGAGVSRLPPNATKARSSRGPAGGQHQGAAAARDAAGEDWDKPSTSGRDSMEELLGEEILMQVKKMRLLQRKGSEMDQKKVVEKTRKYLMCVGDHISQVASARGRNSQRNVLRLRGKLWQYVATYTENNMDGPQLEQVYEKIRSSKHSASDIAPAAAAAQPPRSSQGQKRSLDPDADEPPAKWGRHSEGSAWDPASGDYRGSTPQQQEDEPYQEFD